MASYKDIRETAGPEDIITSATDSLNELADELDEWYDAMSENLKGGDKAQQIQEAAQQIRTMATDLEAVDTDDEHFYPDARITYTISVKTRKAKQPSRQVRFDNIIAALSALSEFYSAVDDEDDHNELIDTLDEAIQEVEIPGAWG